MGTLRFPSRYVKNTDRTHVLKQIHKYNSNTIHIYWPMWEHMHAVEHMSKNKTPAERLQSAKPSNEHLGFCLFWMGVISLDEPFLEIRVDVPA